MQKRESEGGGRSPMPCCVEHEGLVDIAEAMNFRLGCLQPVLQLLSDGVEVTKVTCGCKVRAIFSQGPTHRRWLNLPRSSNETLLDFWLDAGRVSLRRA